MSIYKYDHPYRWEVVSSTSFGGEERETKNSRLDAWHCHRDALPKEIKEIIEDKLIKHEKIVEESVTEMLRANKKAHSKTSLRIDEAITLYYHAIRDNYEDCLREGHSLAQISLKLITLDVGESFLVEEMHGPGDPLLYQHWWFKRIE